MKPSPRFRMSQAEMWSTHENKSDIKHPRIHLGCCIINKQLDLHNPYKLLFVGVSTPLKVVSLVAWKNQTMKCPA